MSLNLCYQLLCECGFSSPDPPQRVYPRENKRCGGRGLLDETRVWECTGREPRGRHVISSLFVNLHTFIYCELSE